MEEETNRRQNSHARKTEDNRRKWRRIFRRSPYSDQPCGGGRLAGIYYDPERQRFDEYSYQSKYKRKLAARAVRRYRGEISAGGMYRKIFDYCWECW